MARGTSLTRTHIGIIVGENPVLISSILFQVDQKGFAGLCGLLWWLGVIPQGKGLSAFKGRQALRHFTPRGVASHSRKGAEKEAAYAVLIVAMLSLACLMGF